VDLVFDSNVIIDALGGLAEGIAELRGAQRRVISRISWIEVMAGCRSLEAERLARRLLASLEIVELNADLAEEAAKIRRTTRLKLPDAIVLATALTVGCQLSTRNTKDFPEADPTIRVPYRL